MPTLLQRVAAPLARIGLDHVGVVAAERYDALAPASASTSTGRVHPGTRSIAVFASGGRAHWDAFLAYVAADPHGRLLARAHPLDDFCAETFASLSSELAGCRVVFPTVHAEIHLDFLALARLAGLGAESELGILVSARFGPWFAMRAAVFTPELLEETGEVPPPCASCPAPCRGACPAGAVGLRPFPWRACVEARASSCAARCDAREACIVGVDARYGELERAYHHDPARARRLLLARFGLDAQG